MSFIFLVADFLVIEFGFLVILASEASYALVFLNLFEIIELN